MEEYIERNALLKEVNDLKKSPWYNDDYGSGTLQARHEGVSVVEDLCIKQAPVENVIKVTRCRNCRYKQENPDINNTYYLTCTLPWGLKGVIAPTDFCSYGKEVI